MEKITILIVEDDRAIVDLYAMCLPDEIFEKIFIAGGEAAIKIFGTVHPELVILDIMLPSLSGPEVLRAIRNNDSETPVIMSTATSRDRDIQTCLQLGIQGYILKPFDRRALCGTVLDLYGRSRPERAAEAQQALAQLQAAKGNKGPQFF